MRRKNPLKESRFVLVYVVTPTGDKRDRMETREPLSYDEALVLGALKSASGLSMAGLVDSFPHILNIRTVLGGLMRMGFIEEQHIDIPCGVL